MKIRHNAWQEVDGVDRIYCADETVRAWHKKINGCYMEWLKADGWYEVDEERIVDVMKCVEVSPYGVLNIYDGSNLTLSIAPHPYIFEKTAMYALPDLDEFKMKFDGMRRGLYGNYDPGCFVEYTNKYLMDCLILKKKY